MSALESLLETLGLIWERFHLISADTVQAPGVTSRWTRGLAPIGDRPVPAGELVELHTTLDHGVPLPAQPPVRFDVLEFDWLFKGGFDDPVTSVKTAAAPAPDGDFAIIEQRLVEQSVPADRSLQQVVDQYRLVNAQDYERGILVAREADADTGRIHVLTWWHVEDVDDAEPTFYFVSELPALRDSPATPLKAAPAVRGANLRLYGHLRDTDPAEAALAQPIPGARLALGTATATTDDEGLFVLDARVPVGSTPLVITRSGIDERRITVRVTESGETALVVDLLDPAANDALLHSATVPDAADLQHTVIHEVVLRARVHRLRGTVTWPDTRVAAAGNQPICLADRRVYAVPLTAGATVPQRPSSSSDWAALRSRSDVLRSARPDRPEERERTAADGAFEVSFVDLTPGSQYLLWVESEDPRAAGTELPEVLVRTVAAPQMRYREGWTQAAAPPAGTDPNPLVREDRRAVDSTYNLVSNPQRGSVSYAVEVVRVVDVGPAAGPPDIRVVRPGRTNPAGIDATPLQGTEQLTYDAGLKRASGLVLESLPLVPVFETADQQSASVRAAVRAWEDRLAARYPRGYVRAATRWVLDARRCAVVTAGWSTAATCEFLENTLLTQPGLAAGQVNDPAWAWWRADVVTLADFAPIRIAGSNALFATRTLTEELVPVLRPPVPRLPALAAGRTVLLAPGHGLYSVPPLATSAAAAVPEQQLSFRYHWVRPHAGEDENAAIISLEVAAILEANACTVHNSREWRDLSRAGVVQTAANTFVAVNPATVPDFPRLWQQNAYYWLGAVHDPGVPPAQQLVLGSTGSQVGTGYNKNNAGITARRAQFAQLAARGLDAFLAVHTNGGGTNTRGTDAMYLDVRPQRNDPAPGTAGYVETNVTAQRFGQLLQDAIVDAVQTRDIGPSTYYEVNGNPAGELANSVSHFHDGGGVQGTRAAAGWTGAQQVTVPLVRNRVIPYGYVEVAFHTNVDDAALLGQRWFRHAVGAAMARATETMIGEHPEAITAEDLRNVLRNVFGTTAEVHALAGGASALTPGDIASRIQTVTGHVVTVTQTRLDAAVSAVEAARDAATRQDLVQRLSRTLATRAGYAVDDPQQADDVARAALGPLVRAGGAPDPQGTAVPALADLPRGARPTTRQDAAAFLTAGLGLRPATLATATAAVNGVTLLPPPAGGAAEEPEAWLTPAAVTAIVTQAARLRPVDIYRPVAVRLTDGGLIGLAAPYRVPQGAEVRLVVATRGTALRATPADVEIVVARAGANVVTLACATRTVGALTSAVWSVPLPDGVTGAQTYTVTARVQHAGTTWTALAPVTFELAVEPGGAA